MRGFIGTYLQVFKITLTNQMAHRVRFFSPLFLDGTVFVIGLCIWYAIFSGKPSIQGYGFSSVATYYALNMATSRFKTRSATGVVGDDIRDGRLSMFLLKPYMYNFSNFVELFTNMLYRSVVPIGIFVFLVLSLPTLFLGTGNLLVYVSFLLMGVAIGYMFYASLGNLAFWTANTWGVFVIIKRFVDILGGSLIPLDFLPQFAQRFTEFLPFRYMTYVPNSVYLGRISGKEAAVQFLIGLLWLLAMFLFQKITWRRGLKRYESVGN